MFVVDANMASLNPRHLDAITLILTLLSTDQPRVYIRIN